LAWWTCPRRGSGGLSAGFGLELELADAAECVCEFVAQPRVLFALMLVVVESCAEAGAEGVVGGSLARGSWLGAVAGVARSCWISARKLSWS
jgi:hypothetical protein